MRIINFGQVMDVESGVDLIHQMTIEHPDGRRFTIRTDEGTVQQLIESMAGMGNEVEVPLQKANPMRFTPTSPTMFPHDSPSEEEEEPGSVFGGDYDPGEENQQSVEPVVGTIAENRTTTDSYSGGGIGQVTQAPVQQEFPNRGRKKRQPLIDKDGFMISPPAKTVPKDEMGYPIVPKRNAQPSSNRFSEEEDGQQI